MIKPDQIPESYWETQKRIVRERGQGVDNIDWEEQKRQSTESIIADQKSSLDKWISYLSSKDSPYSDELKYLTLRSVLSMGEYDKANKTFTKRSKGTTKPFPDLNREALAYSLDLIDKKTSGQPIDVSGIDPDKLERFNNAVQTADFSYLYSWAIEKIKPTDSEELASTQGKWIKYDQGSDHIPLVSSLEGHGTGWCTAGESTAKTQLEGGDFYVYYSNNDEGEPTIPRVAIRMEGDSIAEVRGVAPDQNLDQFIAPIVEQKLEEFPDGDAYQKKVADMKRLTEIDNKIRDNAPLDPSDIAFLYEINGPIQGFGYEKDPRIIEIQKQRDVEEDMPIAFGCEPSQIAHSLDEINEDTKAYVGPLLPGIIDLLRDNNIEHVFVAFPEGRVELQKIEIHSKPKEQLEQEILAARGYIAPHAQDLIERLNDSQSPEHQVLDLVSIKLKGLGLSEKSRLSDILKKAQELGLDKCPPEVGPEYRLQNKNQAFNTYFIAMDPIKDSNRTPDIFNVANSADGTWTLHGSDAGRKSFWDGHDSFVFRIGTSEPAADTSQERKLSSVRTLLRNYLRR